MRTGLTRGPHSPMGTHCHTASGRERAGPACTRPSWPGTMRPCSGRMNAQAPARALLRRRSVLVAPCRSRAPCPWACQSPACTRRILDGAPDWVRTRPARTPAVATTEGRRYREGTRCCCCCRCLSHCTESHRPATLLPGSHEGIMVLRLPGKAYAIDGTWANEPAAAAGTPDPVAAIARGFASGCPPRTPVSPACAVPMVAAARLREQEDMRLLAHMWTCAYEPQSGCMSGRECVHTYGRREGQISGGCGRGYHGSLRAGNAWVRRQVGRQPILRLDALLTLDGLQWCIGSVGGEGETLRYFLKSRWTQTTTMEMAQCTSFESIRAFTLSLGLCSSTTSLL